VYRRDVRGAMLKLGAGGLRDGQDNIFVPRDSSCCVYTCSPILTSHNPYIMSKDLLVPRPYPTTSSRASHAQGQP